MRWVGRAAGAVLVAAGVAACGAAATPEPAPTAPAPTSLEVEAKAFAIESLFKLLSTAQGVGGLQPQEMFSPLNYLRTEIVEAGTHLDGRPITPTDLADPAADPDQANDVADGNWLRVRWATENWRGPRDGLGERWRLMLGESEIRSVSAEVIRYDELTPADRAGGVEWRTIVRLRFTSRSRASVTMGPRPATPPSPDHLFAGWRDEGFLWANERRGGRWSNPEPVRFVLLPLKVLELGTLHARHPEDCAEIRTGCRLTA